MNRNSASAQDTITIEERFKRLYILVGRVGAGLLIISTIVALAMTAPLSLANYTAQMGQLIGAGIVLANCAYGLAIHRTWGALPPIVRVRRP